MKKKSKGKTIQVAENKPKVEPTAEKKMEAAQYLLNAPSTAAQVEGAS